MESDSFISWRRCNRAASPVLGVACSDSYLHASRCWFELFCHVSVFGIDHDVVYLSSYVATRARPCCHIFFLISAPISLLPCPLVASIYLTGEFSASSTSPYASFAVCGIFCATVLHFLFPPCLFLRMVLLFSDWHVPFFGIFSSSSSSRFLFPSCPFASAPQMMRCLAHVLSISSVTSPRCCRLSSSVCPLYGAYVEIIRIGIFDSARPKDTRTDRLPFLAICVTWCCRLPCIAIAAPHHVAFILRYMRLFYRCAVYVVFILDFYYFCCVAVSRIESGFMLAMFSALSQFPILTIVFLSVAYSSCFSVFSVVSVFFFLLLWSFSLIFFLFPFSCYSRFCVLRGLVCFF